MISFNHISKLIGPAHPTLPKSLFFQPKLPVNTPGDKNGKKTCTVTDTAMQVKQGGIPLQALSISPVLRKCNHCDKEKKQIQRKAFSEEGQRPDNSLENYISGLNGKGKPLPDEIRRFYEPRLGYDLSKVKVHTDGGAVKSAQSVHALAYTSGNHIVFNNGQFSPSTDTGKHLLAHELTHVIQQNAAVQPGSIQRRVIDSHVVTSQAMLTRLALSRQEVIDVITAADADAIVLAQNAENTLTTELNNAQSGTAVDANAELILNEELGLSFNNAGHRGLVRQQIRRFRTVRETLESGYLRYLALGLGNVAIIGCDPAPCGTEFASSCPGNRLIVLCQKFWDTPDEQSATVLHEPFHMWFEMARHENNALRRADASCFESFALRVSGRDAFASCDTHTAG